MKQLLRNNGLERRREGGSSGLTDYTSELKMLMSTPNFSPRCAKGTVIVKSINNLKWHVFYIGVKDGLSKYTYYTQPQKGGTFHMKAELLNKYNLLIDFASTKPLAALICAEIEKICNLPVKKISPRSCDMERINISKAKILLHDYVTKSTIKLSGSMKKILYYQYYSSKFLNYTLVCHQVGRHYDVFSDRIPSLENRVCFSFPIENKEHRNTGRGGCGHGCYGFALLDWRSSYSTGKKDVWTSVKNRKQKYSSTWYALNGEVDKIFTDAVWKQFTTNADNNIIHE